MDKGHQIQNKDYNVFKNKCVCIFKQWNSFRVLLDNNPNILTYYNEDGSVLEINELLDNLYYELYDICVKWKDISNDNDKCVNEIAECLISFIEDYFQITLNDKSNITIAKDIVNVYDNMYNTNEIEINICNKNVNMKYKIDFPIITTRECAIPEEEYEDDNDNDNDIQTEYMKGQLI